MRKLTEREIEILEDQGCTAEDWLTVEVDEDDFHPERVRRVTFLGQISIGCQNGSIEVEDGFFRPVGIYHATLRNVNVGNDCLIENVSGFINNYDIGDGTYISQVGILSAHGDSTFGNGNKVSVLNEGGSSNVIIYDKLTAQTAHLMLHSLALRQLVAHEIEARPLAEHGTIGSSVRIVGLRDMQNVCVGDGCEIQGACRLIESTVLSSDESATWIGPETIIDNSIVAYGATITDGAKVYNSFVGECVHIGRGFTAESSLFFANSYMDNGESCAAFCGPFSCSHHKSTLLIGGQFSFYNAGSATNQSNHAYKMGPIHYGVLERGAKTASGCHILWPASVGAFSMVMGKIETHPDTRELPFSYIIAQGNRTLVVPGINLRTVGTWRDVSKWPKRDLRPRSCRRDIIHNVFPNPYVVQQAVKGRRLLNRLLDETPPTEEWIEQPGYSIRRTSAVRGIQYYDLVVKLFIYHVFNHSNEATNEGVGVDEWVDLSGMLAPKKEIDRLMADIEQGELMGTDELLLVLQQVASDYEANATDYAHSLLQQMSDSLFLNQDLWIDAVEQAYAQWLRMVKDDAEREFQMGDVDEDFLRTFLESVK